MFWSTFFHQVEKCLANIFPPGGKMCCQHFSTLWKHVWQRVQFGGKKLVPFATWWTHVWHRHPTPYRIQNKTTIGTPQNWIRRRRRHGNCNGLWCFKNAQNPCIRRQNSAKNEACHKKWRCSKNQSNFWNFVLAEPAIKWKTSAKHCSTSARFGRNFPPNIAPPAPILPDVFLQPNRPPWQIRAWGGLQKRVSRPPEYI